MIDLDDIGEHTAMFDVAALDSPEPQLGACMCIVAHGDDECFVAAPSLADVYMVSRDRRRMLGLTVMPTITILPMAAGGRR